MSILTPFSDTMVSLPRASKPTVPCNSLGSLMITISLPLLDLVIFGPRLLKWHTYCCSGKDNVVSGIPSTAKVPVAVLPVEPERISKVAAPWAKLIERL